MATKPPFLLFAAFVALGSLYPGTITAQTTIEIGNGNVVNSTFEPPSPYANSQPGGRIQLLFPASELQAAGMTAGTITSLGFHLLQPTGTTLQDYSIRLGTTSATQLNTTWETGLSEVWGALDFTDAAGWTMHLLATPYVWDGISNLVLETCYFNGTATQNARVYQTSTSYVSCVSRQSPNPTICTNPGGTHNTWHRRPNTRFHWIPLNAPPVALPVANPAFSCNGTIAFTDNSSSFTDSWSWDFGDGSIDTGQSVVHTYATAGPFTVTLIATNAFGADTAQVSVTVGIADPPIPACDAPSAGSVAGFGILDVSIQGVPHPSGDAVSEGYLDNTCPALTVVQGTPLNVSITTGDGAEQAVRAWVDWDNSGSFTANELLVSGNGPVATGSVLVPSGTLLDSPLRMRAVAAYALVTPDPQPCDTVEYGQAEDYAIIVTPNTDPPVPSFSADPLFSCDGSVQFTDMSLNAPTAWAWDFGDGGTSNDQDPLHQYTASGIYSVSLTANNANGQADTLYSNLITVDLSGLLNPASCIPATQAYCCGYGLLGFQFAGINSTSPDGNEGYQDRSCGNTASVEEGQSYAWSVATSDETPQDVRIWIDLDNNGSFSPAELVATALNAVSPNGMIAIPPGSVFGMPVRLRVQADVIGQSSDPCDAPLYGQSEDFSAIITQNTAPPVANFSATPTSICDGHTQFTDLSTNVPSSWAWDFGDGTQSNAQNPLHTYTGYGTYTISLTVGNAFGSDTETRADYIVSVPEWACDTSTMPTFSNDVDTRCAGVLSDDGGPNADLSYWPSGAYTISPPNATSVTLLFSEFQYGTNPNGFLAIYDGPGVTSPLIVQLSGNTLPGGPITSTGPSITLRQEETGGGPNIPGAGFVLTWHCATTGVPELTEDPILNIHPVPADQWFEVELRPDASNARTFSVVDVNGQVVLEQAVPSHGTRVHVNAVEWPSGVYAVRLSAPGMQWVRTIIIR